MLFPLIPTRIHGMLDYATGLLLIVAPWLFGFADNRAAMLVPLLMGIGVIGYSLLTRYELGIVRLIPMPGHLLLDLGGGILLAASPWLFGFAGRIVWPHLLVGVMEIGAALFTAYRPSATVDTTTTGVVA